VGVRVPLSRAKRGKAAKGVAASAEKAIEQIDAGYAEVFGDGRGLTSRERRRVRRGWLDGDRPWLAMIDAIAVRGGVNLARKRERQFGLGWVLRFLQDGAAQAQASQDAGQAGKRAATEAARKALERLVQEETKRRAAAERLEAFRALPGAQRETLLEKARQRSRFITRPDLLEAAAADLAAAESNSTTEPQRIQR
jgi:hypothetical protein